MDILVQQQTKKAISRQGFTPVRDPPFISHFLTIENAIQFMDNLVQQQTKMAVISNLGFTTVRRPPFISHFLQTFSESTLTDDSFRSIWATGEPLLVTGLRKFMIPWTSYNIKERYGSDLCTIRESQTAETAKVSVGEFFSWFGVYTGRKKIWGGKVRLWMLS